ncbi:MAG: hypothetical protein K2N72_06135 [Oscillospiraceae bacterium]|nr:hypothetical protein [Oscillospiraceae bacterium]
MRSERIGKNALKITLSGSELKNSGISQKEIFDYSSQSLSRSRDGKTEELVKALWQRLLRENAFDDVCPQSFGERPTIEIIPAKDKGCVIYITGENPYYPSAGLTPPKYAAVFFSPKPLIKVCTLLCRSSLSKDSALWANRRSALLTFRLPQKKCDLADDIRELVSVTAINEHIPEAIAEHFSPIIEKNAPEILLKAFGER